MGCREKFLALPSWRKRRAAHEEVRLEAPSECTLHITLAEAAEELRALQASGVFKLVGFPKQVKSVTQWVEMLVSGRAPILPDTTGLGWVINRFSCYLLVDAPSKLTNQVEAAVVQLAS